MLTRFKVFLLSVFACAGLAGLFASAPVSAQNADVGFNSYNGLQGFPGLDVSLGTVPSTTGSTCASGTLTVTGGASAGKVVSTTCTTLVLKLTWTIPALGYGGTNGNGGYSQASFAPTLSGVLCTVIDLTHPAAVTQASTAYVAPTATAAGSISCTASSATITAGDTLLYNAAAF
jgi:hypothetical protein